MHTQHYTSANRFTESGTRKHWSSQRNLSIGCLPNNRTNGKSIECCGMNHVCGACKHTPKRWPFLVSHDELLTPGKHTSANNVRCCRQRQDLCTVASSGSIYKTAASFCRWFCIAFTYNALVSDSDLKLRSGRNIDLKRWQRIGNYQQIYTTRMKHAGANSNGEFY